MLYRKYVKVELHCHSTHSDGTWSIASILKEAEEKGVKILSITDHDNFEGSFEAYKANKFSGILVPGIEISTEILGNSMHFLAFFPTFLKEDKQELLEHLEKIKDSRVWRMKEMIRKANEIGINITWEEVLEEASRGSDGDTQPTDVISRPHLARVLIRKEIVKDFDEAFDKFIGEGKPLHVGRFSLEFDEWVQLVTKLEGIMIWAHPFHGHNEDQSKFNSILDKIEESNIQGVERIYNYKGKYPVSESFINSVSPRLDRMITENDWLITSGGDFHGNVGSIGELELPVDHVKRFLEKLNFDSSKLR